jgi:hypothetical protein
MNFNKRDNYKVFCMEFRTDGTLKKICGEGREKDAGCFYDEDEWGFGGCVAARDETHAEELIREEIEKRRKNKKT